MTSKAIFDFTFALILLPILLPFIFILTIISTIDTSEFGIFTQKRVGKDAQIFSIYKIRTMKGEKEPFLINSKRTTKFGRILRQTKLDETPQILNILFGQMSFVGPRPDIIGYADQLKGDDRIILTVKPGITGPAQLAFRDEESILKQQENPLKYNDEVFWPQKIKINKEYVRNRTFLKDIQYLIQTVFN